MGIIYLISAIVLLIVFILVKKTDKEINLISFISISIVCLFCYNTIVCYILTFFAIPIKLWILTIINSMIAIIFLSKILRNKEIQFFSFKKIDLFYIALLTIIVLIISYINFGIPFNIKYETSDPSVHYLTSIRFAESESLMPGIEKFDEVYGSINVRKTVSYVNSGLLMKCLCPDLDPIDCYNIFVIFGTITLLLTGIALFACFLNFVKNKEHRFWAFLISAICMLGYPLNSFLFGFEYLSMGLLIICTILDLIYYYDNEILKFSNFILIMTLLNFGLFSSYYMFVPFIYPALWIYFCITNYNRTKKIVTTKLVIQLSITLLIPFILGYIYHLAPEIYAVFINKSLNTTTMMNYSSYIAGAGIATNGYIYINLYSNMLLLIPLPIYLFVKDAKNDNLKNNKFIALLLGLLLLFILLLLFGNMLRKVSIYYLSKNYFALWIILIYCNYKALIELSKKGNYFPRLFIGMYIFLMIISTILSNVKMIDDALRNPDENIFSVMEIFGSNKTMLLTEKEKLNQEEINILMYARNNLDYNSEIEVVSEGIQYYWSYVLLRYINKEDYAKQKNIYGGQGELNTKVYLLDEKINKVDYMIYFNRSDKYNKLKDKLFENAEIIYENSAGGILKYNR